MLTGDETSIPNAERFPRENMIKKGAETQACTARLTKRYYYVSPEEHCTIIERMKKRSLGRCFPPLLRPQQ